MKVQLNSEQQQQQSSSSRQQYGGITNAGQNNSAVKQQQPQQQQNKGNIQQQQQNQGGIVNGQQNNGTNQQKSNQNQQQTQQMQQSQQQQGQVQQKYQDMKRIEDYTFCLSDLVGKGASGTVYLGENQVTKEMVAIKVIDLHQVKDEYTWGLICSEIEIMKKLKCENVVRLIDVFQTQNNAYIVTELCEDGDLVEFMKKNSGKIRQNQAVKIITDILRGLQELAKHGIIHRDLKPANILIAKKDTFKITDFGFARMVEKNDYLMTSLVGTPLYMSPQILKRQMYTSKCDVWSIGLIFYELIYGQTPWPSNSVIDLVNNMFSNPLKFPTAGQTGDIILEGVKDFIRSCLKFEEADRICWDDVYKHVLFRDALYSTPKNGNNISAGSNNYPFTVSDERGSQLKSPHHQRDSQNTNKKGSFTSSFQTSFMTSYTSAGTTNTNKTNSNKGNLNSLSSNNYQIKQAATYSNNQKNQTKGLNSASNTNEKNNKKEQTQQNATNNNAINSNTNPAQQTNILHNISAVTTNNVVNNNSTIGNNNNHTNINTNNNQTSNINSNNNYNTTTSTSSNSSNNNVTTQNTQPTCTNLTVVNLTSNLGLGSKSYSKQNSRQNTPSLQKQQTSTGQQQQQSLNIQEVVAVKGNPNQFESSQQSTPRQQTMKQGYSSSTIKQMSIMQQNGTPSTGSFLFNQGNNNNNNNIQANTTNNTLANTVSNTINNTLQNDKQIIPSSQMSNNRQSNISSPNLKDKVASTNQLFGQFQGSSSFIQQYNNLQQPQAQSQNKLDSMRQQYKKQVKDKKSIDFICGQQGSSHNLQSDMHITNNLNLIANNSAVGASNDKISSISAQSPSTTFNFIHKRQKSAREGASNYNSASNNFYIPLPSPTKPQHQPDKYRISTEPNQINDFRDNYSPNKNNTIIGMNRESTLQQQQQQQQQQLYSNQQQNSSSPLSTEPSQNPVPTVLITLGSMQNIQYGNNGQLPSPPKTEESSNHMLNFSNDQSEQDISGIQSNCTTYSNTQGNKIGQGIINLEAVNVDTPEKEGILNLNKGLQQQKGFQKQNSRSITPTMSGSAHKLTSPNTSNNTPKVIDNNINISNSKKALSNFNKFATAVYNSEDRGSKIIQNNSINSNNNSSSNNNNLSNSNLSNKRQKISNRLSHNQQSTLQQSHQQQQNQSKDTKQSESKNRLNKNEMNNSSSIKHFDPFKTVDQILYNNQDESYTTLNNASPKNINKMTNGSSSYQKNPQSFTNITSQNNLNQNKPQNIIQLTLNSNQGNNNNNIINSNTSSTSSQSILKNQFQSEKKGNQANSHSPTNKINNIKSATKQTFPSHQYKSYDFSSQISNNPLNREQIGTSSYNSNGIALQFAPQNSQLQIPYQSTNPKSFISNEVSTFNNQDIKNDDKQISQGINIPTINLNKRDASNSSKSQIAQVNLAYPQTFNGITNTTSQTTISNPNKQNVFSQLYNLEISNYQFPSTTQGTTQIPPTAATATTTIINSQDQNPMINNIINLENKSVSNQGISGVGSIVPIDLKKTNSDFYSPQPKNQKFQFENNNQNPQHSNTTSNVVSFGSTYSMHSRSKKSTDFTSYQRNLNTNYPNNNNNNINNNNNNNNEEGNQNLEILNNYLNFCRFLFNLVRIINNSNFDKSIFAQNQILVEKISFILLKNAMIKLQKINEKMYGLGENIFNLNDWNNFKNSGKYMEMQTQFFLLSTEIQSNFESEYHRSTNQSAVCQQINQDYSFIPLLNKDMADDLRFYSIALPFVKLFINLLNSRLSYVLNHSDSTTTTNDKNDIVALLLLDDFLQYHEILKTNLICMDSFHNQIFIKFNSYLMKFNNTYNYLTLCAKTLEPSFVFNLKQKIREYGF